MIYVSLVSLRAGVQCLSRQKKEGKSQNAESNLQKHLLVRHWTKGYSNTCPFFVRPCKKVSQSFLKNPFFFLDKL